MAIMYLRSNRRIKDGKEHRYWNIVESKRCAGGKVVQRQVLYLGEINDSQRQAWWRVIEAFDEQSQQRTQLALFYQTQGSWNGVDVLFAGAASMQPQRIAPVFSYALTDPAGHGSISKDRCAGHARRDLLEQLQPFRA